MTPEEILRDHILPSRLARLALEFEVPTDEETRHLAECDFCRSYYDSDVEKRKAAEAIGEKLFHFYAEWDAKIERFKVVFATLKSELTYQEFTAFIQDMSRQLLEGTPNPILRFGETTVNLDRCSPITFQGMVDYFREVYQQVPKVFAVQEGQHRTA